MKNRESDPPLLFLEEGRIFAHYLIGETIPDDIARRYADFCVLHTRGERRKPSNARLMRFARRRPWSIGLLDAGCALLQKDHLLRRQLLALSAILEASPHYIEHFLPDRRADRLLTPKILYTAARAGIKGAAGCLFLVSLRVLWRI
jgi:hypothetical protein